MNKTPVMKMKIGKMTKNSNYVLHLGEQTLSVGEG